MTQSITLRGASDAALAEVSGSAMHSRPHGEWEQALEDGLAFSWSNATYDYDASDTILGVENNSATRDLKIKRILITGSTATEFIVHASSGVTMAGTAVTGVNLNRNSNNTADATAIGDETGNGQAAASYSGRLLTGRFANNGIVDIAVDGAIVLPNDHNIGVDFVTNGTAANVTVWGYYVDR
jgi:hypothetical protein